MPELIEVSPDIEKVAYKITLYKLLGLLAATVVVCISIARYCGNQEIRISILETKTIQNQADIQKNQAEIQNLLKDKK